MADYSLQETGQIDGAGGEKFTCFITEIGRVPRDLFMAGRRQEAEKAAEALERGIPECGDPSVWEKQDLRWRRAGLLFQPGKKRWLGFEGEFDRGPEFGIDLHQDIVLPKSAVLELGQGQTGIAERRDEPFGIGRHSII